jgi:hypothetical protein
MLKTLMSSHHHPWLAVHLLATVATPPMERTIPVTVHWGEPFDVDAGTGTPGDDKDYEVPFRFTGKLTKLALSIDRPRLTPQNDTWRLPAAKWM